MGKRRPLIVQMVHDLSALEPRCRFQDEDSEEYGSPIVSATAVADVIRSRTEALLMKTKTAVSPKPIVMRAEYAHCPNLTIIDTPGFVLKVYIVVVAVSADLAHGVHPNFAEKHEEKNHSPQLHKGLVIKHNANQHYATSGITCFLFKQVAKLHDLPIQEVVVRNDMGCGSTIGPILASGIRIRTVECGIAQLSMHSVREVCGTDNIDIAYRHFKVFYRSFSSVDRKLVVDDY